MRRLLLLILFVTLICGQTAWSAETIKQLKPMTMNRTLQVKQFKPMTAVIIKKPLKFKLLRPIVTPTPVKPEGPDPNASIDLADMIDDANLLEDLSFVCGWDPHLIFQDKKAGNVFYYLPREFRLVHQETSGYGLNVQYNHLKDEDTPSVMLTAQLAAPHHAGDITLLKSILKQAFELKPADKLTLKAISGIGATADMQGISAGLSLPPDRINLTMPSHLKQTIRLTISLDQDETEEVLAQISREGLTGSLNVKVGDASVPIPIHLQYLNFSGKRLDGFSQWVNKRPTGILRNITAFPVKIDSINCYKVNAGKLERISKRLKPSTILSGRKKSFKLPPVKQVLGNNVMMAWLETNLDSSCTPCVQSIDKKVRKGVSTAASSTIKFEAIPMVFSDFDIYKIIVEVQSPYFNADPGEVALREIELTEDDNISKTLVIYQPEGKGSEPLLYRYRLKLITSEGKTINVEQFKDSRTLSQFFGASQIEPILEDNGDVQ